MPGWRTLVINEKSSLAVEDSQLMVEGKQTVSLPLEQLRHVLISSQGSVITVDAVAQAVADHIRFTVCNQKHLPVCEVVPIGCHHEAAGAVIDQAEWTQDRKDAVWKRIVEMKLNNQLALLREKDRLPPPRFLEYCRTVEPGDRTNREAVAAKMYFTSLFGRQFRRHAADTVNAKLNYGYTILCSAFSRILAMHGYHTGLGIHHLNRDNPVNLSSDLMEPFRPLVDRIVYESGEEEMNWEMRKKLIAIPNQACRLNDSAMTVDEAMEAYSLVVLRSVKQGEFDLPEVVF